MNALEYDRMVAQSNKQQELIERQHEAITSLRKQLETEHTARLNVAAMRQKMCDEIEILRLECEVYRGIIADTENLK